MKTKIPKTLLPHLYKEEVYRIHVKEKAKSVPAESVSETESPSEVAAGNEVGIIIADPNPPMELLEKILGAVNLKISAVDLLNELPGSTESYSKILTFGTEAHPSYESNASGTCSILHADSLEAISQDVNLKKKLWAALKTLFL